MIDALKHGLRIAFFLLLQGLVLNRMDLWQGWVLPSLYIFGLIMLPINTPRVVLLFIGFVTGLIMDAFTNTGGLHASACVLLTFLQPLALQFLAPRDGYEVGQQATVHDLGITWFITYGGLLTLVHHSWLFFLEQWRLTPFFSTLSKVVISSVITVLLMIISQYLIHSSKDRRNA
jgi:rod shape-determining protein MreD